MRILYEGYDILARIKDNDRVTAKQTSYIIAYIRVYVRVNP